jgi:ligand-binding sensor domain-containing protein
MFLAYCSCAFALNPTLDVSQYAHTAWKVSDGFFAGIIFSIAQTPDGYLWIGTDSGLFRFDGVRSVPWHPPAGSHLPGSDIRSLRAARDGRLWIGTARGLASLKDGRLTRYPEFDGHFIEALLEDREGTIWVGSWGLPVGRLCTIHSSKTECYGEDGRFGSGVTALYEDSGGILWAGTMTGLWRWKPGTPKVYPMPDPADRVNALIETDDGGILVTKDSGIAKLKNGKTEMVPLPAGLEFQPANSFATAMARFGSGPWWTAGCSTSTRVEAIYSPDPTGSRAKPSQLSSRIVKGVSGWQRSMASTAFATSPSRGCRLSKACRAMPFCPSLRRKTAASGWARIPA